jgi:hypothetical protein
MGDLMSDALKDLDFAQQLSKEGLLNQTTTCCATGTRGRVRVATLVDPVLSDTVDEIDPYSMRESLPALDLSR